VLPNPTPLKKCRVRNAGIHGKVRVRNVWHPNLPQAAPYDPLFKAWPPAAPINRCACVFCIIRLCIPCARQYLTPSQWPPIRILEPPLSDILCSGSIRMAHYASRMWPPSHSGTTSLSVSVCLSVHPSKQSLPNCNSRTFVFAVQPDRLKYIVRSHT